MPSPSPVRGSQSGRPIMVLLDVLGKRWTLRILWEIRDGSLTFRALQDACGGISPTVLNARLKTLREYGMVELTDAGYGLTADGKELGQYLTKLDGWATVWAEKNFPG